MNNNESTIYGNYTDKDGNWSFVKVKYTIGPDYYRVQTLITDKEPTASDRSIHKSELKDAVYIQSYGI